MAMLSSRLLFALVAVPLFGAGAVIACGDDGESKTVPTVDGGTSSSGGSSGASSSGNTSSSGGSSGSPDQDSSTEDGGGGPCGTGDFGKPAVNFVDIVDASDNGPYVGGDLGEFTYDAVIAERNGGGPGSWRETFVAGKNNRFTRIRQNDNDGGGVKPVAYRSGTYSGDAGSLKLTFDCSQDGDASVVDPSDTIPFEVTTINGKTYYRYGAAGVRIWLEKR